MELGYPKLTFNVPELVWGRFTEMPPLAPLLSGFAESLISESGEPDVVIRYVDVSDGVDAATVSCEYGTTIYMTPTANQACVVDVFKHERDEDGWITESVHDYYQLPYAEIPLRIEHHMAGAVGGGDLLPFVSEVNNVQLEEWFRENCVDAYSRQNFGLAHGSPKIVSSASEIQLEE